MKQKLNTGLFRFLKYMPFVCLVLIGWISVIAPDSRVTKEIGLPIGVICGSLMILTIFITWGDLDDLLKILKKKNKPSESTEDENKQ